MIRITAILGAVVVILLLGVSVYEYREAARLRVEISRLDEEQGRIQTRLNESEQQSLELARRAGQAEQRNDDLRRQLDEVRLAKPAPAAASAADSASEARKRTGERMAQLKPLLEAGQPIKGAVLVLVDGKPVPRQVEFVMGRETQIDAADDGTYFVTPSLNNDGSVSYAISLLRKAAGGGREQAEKLPTVIQTPWDGFILGTGGGKVVAFDPDKSGP